MNILQVSTADRGGGAEGSALNLFRAYRERDHGSWLAVGRKYGRDADVFEIPRVARSGPRGILFGQLARLARASEGTLPGARKLARVLGRLADRERFAAWRDGREELSFPGTERLLDLPPKPVDLIHCHNLHGWYFGLRALPALSSRVPVVLNLRDAWLLTGHCAYPCDCPRWALGCGRCPDLKRYPGVHRDGTAANRAAKTEILGGSRVYVTAPSQWLLDAARQSTLSRAAGYRVIPNGIDLDAFSPDEPKAARQRLGLPRDAPLVMFAAASRRNVYKDPDTMVETIRDIARRRPRVQFLCIGRGTPPRELADKPVIAIPFQRDPRVMADYYRAADVFVHTARAEAFGKTTAEAMACGTPVVASAVGGLCDQLIDGITGFLAPMGNAHVHAQAAVRLLDSLELRTSCSVAAARRGAEFGLGQQTSSFLSWYQEILAETGKPK